MGYRTSRRSSKRASTFYLIYEVEAVIPTMVMVPLARLALAIKLVDPHDRILEAHEERRRRGA